MLLKADLEHLMTDSEVTGLAAATVEEGAITGIHTLGILGDAPVDLDTLWAVASLTKPVLGYAALQLAEQGVIDLDHPLQNYLPTPYLKTEPYLAQMTARHALSHTTGFPNWRDSHGLRAAFAPGTRFSYSSEGLNFLQVVVEHLLNLPLGEYLARNLFMPLQMYHTELGVENPNDLNPHLKFLRGALLSNGALSLRTSIGDYARFMSAMFEVDPPPPLLSRSGRQAMLQPQIAVGDIPNLHWGLGWGLQTSSSGLSFWHWGARGTPQSMSFALGLPEQCRALVIFTNHSKGLVLCRSLIEAWLGESALPAFEWLLPAETWRADGTKRIIPNR